MSNEYVIQWRSMVNGRAGRGSKTFTRHEADRIARELNEEYPNIVHEVIPAPPALHEPDTEHGAVEPIRQAA